MYIDTKNIKIQNINTIPIYPCICNNGIIIHTNGITKNGYIKKSIRTKILNMKNKIGL